MTREGTRGEKLFALLMGVIVYAFAYIASTKAVGDLTAPALVWLVSLALGVVASFATALIILKLRK